MKVRRSSTFQITGRNFLELIRDVIHLQKRFELLRMLSLHGYKLFESVPRDKD